MPIDSSELGSSPRGHWQLVPIAHEDGMRLDQYLPLYCGGLSRTQLRRIIDLGGVAVAGRRVRSCSRAVRTGEPIAVHCDGQPLEIYQVRDTDILWRDRDLLALDKPAGIETQPTPARYQGTLYAAVMQLLKDPARPQVEPSLGMVQRLDRETSGVILFSTSPRAHKRLTELISTRQTQKTYLALVVGQPASGEQEIRSQLARCRDNRVRSVERGGQEAITRYRVVRHLRGASLVEVELVTGRMHQIRAHLSEAGFPLLGDQRYEGPTLFDDVRVARHMLHAQRIELPHPVSGVSLRIEAPLPRDLSELLDRLARPFITTSETEPC